MMSISHSRFCRRYAWCVLLMVLSMGFGARIQAEPSVVLTIIDAQQRLELTSGQLQALPQQRIATHTQWTDGQSVFEGPLVRDVLALAGITPSSGKLLVATALNDYEVDIPLEDFFTWDVILARKQDGRELSRRDRGPLWIVYPRDTDKQLQDARYDHRWAWQLHRLSVKQ